MLKYRNDAGDACSNRTFMELKLHIINILHVRWQVLIAPLWN